MYHETSLLWPPTDMHVRGGVEESKNKKSKKYITAHSSVTSEVATKVRWGPIFRAGYQPKSPGQTQNIDAKTRATQGKIFGLFEKMATEGPENRGRLQFKWQK